jgi:hypothetical protein
LLKKLNLKLVHGPPSLFTSTAPACPPMPASSTLTPDPSPVGCVTLADDVTATGSLNSSSAPSGIMTTIAEDFDSDEKFFWTGNEGGWDFDVPSPVACKSNASISLYPSLFYIAIEVIPLVQSLNHQSCLAGLTMCSITLPKTLHAVIACMFQAATPGPGHLFTVADAGTTDHKFPDKSKFISYKSVWNLQVRMGSISFLPVLGCGTAIISLNGQQALVWNALNIPGLMVPLYSLWTHFQQWGYGFLGTWEAGMMVYFPTFMLSVNIFSDCHLAYDSLGCTETIHDKDHNPLYLLLSHCHPFWRTLSLTHCTAVSFQAALHF